MRIRNWQKFQHYKTLKGRNPPPWIKLHRKLLDNPQWHGLEPAAAKALIGLWLIASEGDGELPASDVLAFRLRTTVHEMVDILKSLHANGFVEVASGVLDNCYQDASTEVEEEENKKRTTLVHGDAPTGDWPAKPERNGRGYIYPPLFERAWEAYPPRQGPNPKVGAYKAFRSRVRAGDDPKELVAAAEHYADHCAATEKAGTPYVQQAATFWGPSEPFREFIEEPRTNGTRPMARPAKGGGLYVGG